MLLPGQREREEGSTFQWVMVIQQSLFHFSNLSGFGAYMHIHLVFFQATQVEIWTTVAIRDPGPLTTVLWGQFIYFLNYEE